MRGGLIYGAAQVLKKRWAYLKGLIREGGFLTEKYDMDHC